MQIEGGASDNTIGGSPTLLIANDYANTVGFYSAATGALLSSLTGNATSNPFNLAYGPDGNIYVSYQFANEVLRYNGVTGAFMDTFISGASGGLNYPTSMVFTGNYLLIASLNSNQILRYNATTGAFVDVFASGNGLNEPDAMRIGPDGDLNVSSIGDLTIKRYNVSTGAFLGQFSISGEADGMAFAPDGTLYVANAPANRIDHFNPQTGAFLGVFASGGRLNGPNDLYVNADGSVDVLNYLGNDVVQLSSTGQDLGVIVSGLDNPTHFLVNQARNIISGNTGDGVDITDSGTTGNVVEGNFIGTDVTGTVAVANSGNGVSITNAVGNIIGGNTTGAGNVISGNTGDGLSITGTGLPSGLVSLWSGNGSGADSVGGNNLTLNGAVTFTPGEVGDGFTFGPGGYAQAGQSVATGGNNWSFDAWVNWQGIGGEDHQFIFSNGNSGANGYGLLIQGTGSRFPGSPDELVVYYGAVGYCRTGVVLPTNQSVHLALVLSSSNVLTLYLNGVSVFTLNTTSPNAPTSGTFILSHGLDPVGDGSSDGITSFNGQIDAASMWDAALTQAQVAAIYNAGSAGKGNLIEGNYIGVDATGMNAVPNQHDGVVVIGASGTIIGGPNASARNIISGNFDGGVQLENDASNNLLEGNYIGVAADGSTPFFYLPPNGPAETGVGVSIDSSNNNTLSGNVISGAYTNISIGRGLSYELPSTGNKIQSNFIGVDSTGGNIVHGDFNDIVIGGGAADNTIGGVLAGQGNVIGGAVNGTGSGIRFFGDGGAGNLVEGNSIGVYVDAMGRQHQVANFTGVVIINDTGDTIGGLTATPGTGAGNIIAGNVNGIAIAGTTGSGDVIEGNLIGTADGTTAFTHVNIGVNLDGAAGNTIGGADSQARNIISGSQFGVYIGSGSTGNNVQGNYIGADVNGNAPLANVYGVYIDGTSGNVTGNVIGGTTAGARNVISGNTGDGVDITGGGATGNVVEGNYIGTNAAGSAGLGNGRFGVDIYAGASGNTIGGATTGAGNIISDNASDGVRISDAGTNGNVVEANVISGNGGYAVAIASGAQADVSGSVTGDVFNDGVLSLHGLGFLDITGNYTQTADGSLVLDLGGTDYGTFDQLQVSGAVTLAGNLTAHLIDGFAPTVGESDAVITFLSRTGAFASQHFDNPGNGDVLTSSVGATFVAIQAVAPSSDLVLAGHSSANATAGGVITYTLTVSNDGPDGQANVNLSDVVPTGTTLASWTLQSVHRLAGTWTLNALGRRATLGPRPPPSRSTFDVGDVAVFALAEFSSTWPVTPAGTIDTNTAAHAAAGGRSRRDQQQRDLANRRLRSHGRNSVPHSGRGAEQPRRHRRDVQPTAAVAARRLTACRSSPATFPTSSPSTLPAATRCKSSAL